MGCPAVVHRKQMPARSASCRPRERFSSSTPCLKAGSAPNDIDAGPTNDTIPFTEADIKNIGELTTSDGNPQHSPSTNLSIPTASSFVSGIARGPLQDMWFAEENVSQISELR